jgi:beta-lactamase class D
MSSNIGTNTVRRAQSPLEDFLHRTNNAGLHVEEPSPNKGGHWEVINKTDVLEQQDKDEWVLVGKTGAEKKKREEERKAKEQTNKRAEIVRQY